MRRLKGSLDNLIHTAANKPQPYAPLNLVFLMPDFSVLIPEGSKWQLRQSRTIFSLDDTGY
jgi:hypothetical protein